MLTFKVSSYLIPVFLLLSSIVWAQNDSIQLKNNDVLVGEIKTLSNGILIIKTSYSDEDFKIEFSEVKGFIIQRKCLVLLTDGRRRFGHLRTNETGIVAITSEDDIVEHFKLEEVIALQEVDDKFWNRFKGGIDLGYNVTKANNNAQFTIGGQFEYIDELWLLEGNINVLNSTQDHTDQIKRTDGNLELRRLFSRKWYLLGSGSFLANTEQALKGRTNPSIGIGKLMFSTNKLYLGLAVGFAYNFENYEDTSFNKSTPEAFIFTGFNMYNFNDFNLKTGLKFYPSLSERGRVRVDYDLTFKYDLPFDFYIKMGYTINFDNQPVIVGNDYDYIFTSGFGWKFN